MSTFYFSCLSGFKEVFLSYKHRSILILKTFSDDSRWSFFLNYKTSILACISTLYIVLKICYEYYWRSIELSPYNQRHPHHKNNIKIKLLIVNPYPRIIYMYIQFQRRFFSRYKYTHSMSARVKNFFLINLNHILNERLNKHFNIIFKKKQFMNLLLYVLVIYVYLSSV